MNKTYKIIVAALFFTASTMVQAERAAGIRFSSDILGLSYLNEMDKGEMAVNGLFNETKSDQLISIGYSTEKSNIKSGGVRVALGAKLYFAHNDSANKDGAGLAIGAGVTKVMQGDLPITLTLSGYYSPSITSFMDAESYTDVGIQVAMELMPNSKMFVGYRSSKVDYGATNTYQMDGEAHIGMTLAY